MSKQENRKDGTALEEGFDALGQAVPQSGGDMGDTMAFTPLGKQAGCGQAVPTVIARPAQKQNPPVPAAPKGRFQSIHNRFCRMLHQQQRGHAPGKKALLGFPHVSGREHRQHRGQSPIRMISGHPISLSAMATAAAIPPSWDIERCSAVIFRWAAWRA